MSAQIKLMDEACAILVAERNEARSMAVDMLERAQTCLEAVEGASMLLEVIEDGIGLCGYTVAEMARARDAFEALADLRAKLHAAQAKVAAP